MDQRCAHRGGILWEGLFGHGRFKRSSYGSQASGACPPGSAPNEERKKNMFSALEHEIELLQDLQHEIIVQYLCW